MSSPRVLEACHEDAVSRDQWLEQELVGPSLGILVDELVALVGTGGDERHFGAREAAEWLGDDLEAVLGHGLGALPRKRVDELFRRPLILGGLQELVLVEGGDHWDGLLARHEVLAATAAFHRRQLARRLGLTEPAEEGRTSTTAPRAVGRARGRGTILALAAATVAGAILAAVILPRLRSAGTGAASPVDDRGDAEPPVAPAQAGEQDVTDPSPPREQPEPAPDQPAPDRPPTDGAPAAVPADDGPADPTPAEPVPAAEEPGEDAAPGPEPGSAPGETAEPDSSAPAPAPGAAARHPAGRRSLPPLGGRCTLRSCG